MNEDKKYVIMVLSCTTAPFDMLEQTQRETWASEPNPTELDTIFYYGDPSKGSKWEEDRLTVRAEEGTQSIKKSLMALDEVLKKYKNASHVFFTNASSYIIKTKIVTYLNNFL